MEQTPIAETKDHPDHKQFEWGRDRHEGYKFFGHRMQQPAPMFFTRDGHPLWLGDFYRGRSAFLIASGPSFAALDKTPLRQPGILTMGINNSPRTFRPNLWVSVDSPDHWIRSIWLDPTIIKFVPLSHQNKKVFNSDKWQFMRLKVGECPSVVYYRRNEHFQHKQFLTEDCFNWGNHKSHGGGRSVLLPAIRIMFLLGIRNLYLLGVDLNMSETNKYHFDQDRNKGAINGNNATYEKLNEWFKLLRPLFEKEGFFVYNCNPTSKLTAFPFKEYQEAVFEALGHMDYVDVSKERTRGLYDTKTEDKEKGIGA